MSNRSPRQVWQQADKYDVPRIALVNKMDKIGADFYFSVRTMEERLGANAVPIQLPIGAEGDFEGVIDLVEMNAKVWRGETKLGETYDTVDIPADLAEKAEEYRTKLLEVVAETDEELLEEGPRRRGTRRRRDQGRDPQGSPP